MPGSSYPAGVKRGVGFTSLTVDVTRYLPLLFSRIKAQGGAIIKARLPTNDGFAHALAFAKNLIKNTGLNAPIFVNATGLGAKSLVGDQNVFPTRGQTVLVKGEAHTIRTLEGQGKINYVLPRAGSGMTVLGGTKEADNW